MESSVSAPRSSSSPSSSDCNPLSTIPSYIFHQIFAFVPNPLNLRLVSQDFDEAVQQMYLSTPSPVSHNVIQTSCTCSSIADVYQRYQQLPWLRAFTLFIIGPDKEVAAAQIEAFFIELESDFLSKLSHPPHRPFELMLRFHHHIYLQNALLLLEICKTLSERHGVHTSIDFITLEVYNINTVEDYASLVYSPLFLHVNAWDPTHWIYTASMSGEEVCEPAIVTFSTSPYLKNLKKLTFRSTQLTAESADWLSKSTTLLPSIVEFVELQAEDAECLFASPTYPLFLRKAKTIILTFYVRRDDDWSDRMPFFKSLVLDNPYKKQLTTLHLSHYEPYEDSIEDVQSFTSSLPSLTHLLMLRGGWTADQIISHIASEEEKSVITELQSLTLSCTYSTLETSTLKHIVFSHNFSRLTSLVLHSNTINDEDLVWLGETAHFVHLTSLSIRSVKPPKSDAPLLALFSSSSRAYPQLVNFECNIRDTESVKLLQACPSPPKNLRRMNLFTPRSLDGAIHAQIKQWNPRYEVICTPFTWLQ